MEDPIDRADNDSDSTPRRMRPSFVTAALSTAAALLLTVFWSSVGTPRCDATHVYLPNPLGTVVLVVAILTAHGLALRERSRICRSRGIALRLLGAFVALLLVGTSCTVAASDPGGGSSELRMVQSQVIGDVTVIDGHSTSGSYGHAVYFIATRTSRGLFAHEYRIEARNGYAQAPVLGPPATDVGKSLNAEIHVTGSGIVGIRERRTTDLGWVLIWDPRTRRVLYDRVHRSASFLILLDRGVEPDPRDIEHLASLTEWARQYDELPPNVVQHGLAAERDLLEAMNDERSSVRAGARAIVTAGGAKLYPNGMKALDERR